MIDLVPEQTIGNYRVIRRIGRGGCGSVYEVESLDLHERYALKTFTYDPAEDEDDLMKNKFLEEGKILARLRHPNIAHVYTLASDDGLGLLYFVMDLVLSEDGRPYSLENASFADLEEDTALAWFTDVCEALDYIHAQGIVHRDIKPGNLLVRQDGHAVLTDFGIAKVRSGKMKAEVNPAMTMRIDGNITVLGSNHYIAPEVDRGEEVTPAADAYSLGVMMFEMLTGKWYDRVEDPWSLLEGRKYPWARVLSMFLAENPEDRPLGYAAIAKRLPNWTEPETVSATAGKDSPRRAGGKMTTTARLEDAFPWGVVVVFVSLALIAVGAAWYFLLNGRTTGPAPVSISGPAPVSTRSVPVSDDEPPAVRSAVDEGLSQKPVETTPAPVAETVPPAPPVVAKPTEVRPTAESPRVEPEKKPEPKPVVAPTTAESPPPPRKLVMPARTYDWSMDSSARSSRPREIDFELASGAKIIFCAVPGERVWFSKYCITAAQCRDFNKFVIPKVCAELERQFPDSPVCCQLLPTAWTAYCALLTDRYRSKLPKGWTFRLATESEFEGAFSASRRRALENLPSAKYNPGNPRLIKRFADKLKSERRMLPKGMDGRGFMMSENVCIGGLTDPNPLGIHDLWLDNWPQFVTVGGEVHARYGRTRHEPVANGQRAFVHIVVGPASR